MVISVNMYINARYEPVATAETAKKAPPGVCVANLANLASLGEKQQHFKCLVQVGQLANLGATLANLAAFLFGQQLRRCEPCGGR